MTRILIVATLFIVFHAFGHAQTPSSPANWLYPYGNFESTRSQFEPSFAQSMDSIVLKWYTESISGDVQPLVGNIKNNPQLLPQYLWSPNELVAVVKDKIVVIEGTGRLLCETPLPPYVRYVKGISVLFDSNAVLPSRTPTLPLTMGLETIEAEDTTDRLSYAYLAGYHRTRDSVVILRRLSVDLSEYDSNYRASVRPVFGRNLNSQTTVYAIVNIGRPRVLPIFSGNAPYFRGLTQFNTGSITTIFPLPDSKDQEVGRITVGPEISQFPPSLALDNLGGLSIAPPTYPSPGLQEIISNPATSSTFGDFPYLLSFNLQTPLISEDVAPQDLSLYTDASRSRPHIRPYIATLDDASTGAVPTGYILVAEEYSGRDSSQGVSRLHLYRRDGTPATAPGDPIFPSFVGGKNHHWSIGIGNADGDALNELLPFYPNSPGNEIIATQSSRESAFPGSRLYVLRWRSATGAGRVEKITRPGSYLQPFDTLCSARINGWLAAVNDFDGAVDRKTELFVADRSTVTILRMRSYSDPRFRFGAPFDTVKIIQFPNETITAVIVADLEGDGRNDLVVTTMTRTYVYGSLLPGAVRLSSLTSQQSPPQEFCLGDTLELRWTNLLRGQDQVHVLFRHYDSTGKWQATLDTLFSSVLNTADSSSALLIAENRLIGKYGRIMVVGANSPAVRDSSAIIQFTKPRIRIVHPSADSTVIAGLPFTLQSSISCLDSVETQYFIPPTWAKADASGQIKVGWQTLRKDGSSGISFAATENAPWVSMFRCDSSDYDSTLLYRLVGHNKRYGIADTSQTLRLRILPAALSMTVDPAPAVACPQRTITWSAILPNPDFLCPELTVAYSTDNGKTFRVMDIVPRSLGSYIWNVPTELKDSTAILRLCCGSDPVRTDTLIRNIVVQYIQLIVPNPFAPPSEVMEVIYSVPKETTASIRIYDQANRLVAEPVVGERRLPGIAYCDRWDGNNSRGIAANGMYYLIIELADGTRQTYKVFVKKR